MTITLKKIKLTDLDKRVISKNSNICTESHGKGCSEMFLNIDNKTLN